MLYSHNFGSPETMDRARFWLTWHGFAVQDSAPSSDPSRLAVRVTFAEAAAVRALIDSIEHTHAGSPNLLTPSAPKTWRTHAPSASAPLGTTTHAATPIHWEGRNDASAHVEADRVAEYMFSRWE